MAYLSSLFLLLAAYPIYCYIYNVYIHPLAKFSGPKLWVATRITFIISLWKGDLVHDVQKIHAQYGDIVRVAPNELSFAKGAAWQDIYSQQPGSHPFPKNPVWWSAQRGRPNSILSVKDPAEHARIRRLLSHCFSERAMKEQEYIIQSYVDRLISKLRSKTAPQDESKRNEATLDIVRWFNYTTFDVIGDLAFGESFNCLQDNAYHPWIEMIFNHFKAASLVAATRFYPWLNLLLMSCIPKSVLKIQREHYELGAEKIHRRLNLETQRDDFLSYILKHNDEKGMTVPEIEATFNTLIIAGSETTATVLSGMTNYLIRNPHALKALTHEIRTTFKDEKSITFARLKELPYLHAVIEEGLRMCPPVPAGLPRVVPKGGAAVCGYMLPEDTNVSVPSWTVSQSQSTFFQPQSFLPERWLPEALDQSSPFACDQRSAIQPFSVGPRQCVGKLLAYAEMRLVLARLVWAFDLGVASPRGEGMIEWDKQKTWVLVSKVPLEIKITERGN